MRAPAGRHVARLEACWQCAALEMPGQMCCGIAERAFPHAWQLETPTDETLNTRGALIHFTGGDAEARSCWGAATSHSGALPFPSQAQGSQQLSPGFLSENRESGGIQKNANSEQAHGFQTLPFCGC